MYGKIVNGDFIESPSYLVYDNKIHVNPSTAKLVELGYKPVTTTGNTGTLASDEYWKITYTEDSNNIYQTYTKAKYGSGNSEELNEVSGQDLLDYYESLFD